MQEIWRAHGSVVIPGSPGHAYVEYNTAHWAAQHLSCKKGSLQKLSEANVENSLQKLSEANIDRDCDTVD